VAEGGKKANEQKMTLFKMDLNFEIGSRKANVQKNDAVEKFGRTRGVRLVMYSQGVIPND
jgi:hypothetical protein